MSGLDSDILREKIKQKMPKPPKFSFGLKAFLAAAIISMVLLLGRVLVLLKYFYTTSAYN